MQGYQRRYLTEKIKKKLTVSPIVAILGPRQCGKSTLAKHEFLKTPNALYLDLERPSDKAKLHDPEAFFSLNQGRLICLDEIQRIPELFPVLRSMVDEDGRPGQFLLLGSASESLLRQSSESLAGRIAYLELSPFFLPEVMDLPDKDLLHTLWLKGGFPHSFMQSDTEESLEWRRNFIRTFLERDIPQLGIRIPSNTLHHFWQMCAHWHGNLLNASQIGESLGMSHTTIRHYLSLFQETFMLRLLSPYTQNLRKRVVKSPKLYLRDSGILHALAGIRDINDLLGHPVYGASWEGFVIENILSLRPDFESSFYRSVTGAEIDLILEKGTRKIAIECKASTSPVLTKGFWQALHDLQITEVYVIAPVKTGYPIKDNIWVLPLAELLEKLAG